MLSMNDVNIFNLYFVTRGLNHQVCSLPNTVLQGQYIFSMY
uniref:Uncharacterized protein n=1 Tax=Arundo donax TaxID=35708 RepID=A0A0A8Y5P1_ARUDO